jgi:hypothetical protein
MNILKRKNLSIIYGAHKVSEFDKTGMRSFSIEEETSSITL